MSKFSIVDATGGGGAVLEALMNNSRFLAQTHIPVAMTMARAEAQHLCEKYCEGLIDQALRDGYEMYVLSNGEYEDIGLDPDAVSEWEEGLDNMVETVLSPYEHNVSAGWFGNAVIDTRLYLTKDADPISKLVTSFAKEVWGNLINVLVETGERDDRGRPQMQVVELTTAKILSAIGVVQSDIEALMATRAEPTGEAEETKGNDVNLNTTLNTIKEYIDMLDMDEGTVVSLLENAIDDDDGLALSGISQLGGEMSDVESLRVFAMMGGAEPAKALYALIQEGPYEEDAPTGAPVAPAPTASNSKPAAAPAVEKAGAPASARQSRKSAVTATTPGAIPAEAFVLIREHIKKKDEDVGGMLGVSRGTFLNYAKGKPVLVPTPEQKQALLNMLVEARNGLDKAYSLIQDT